MSTMTTGPSVKITRDHLDRIAVIYVRQSTLAQVRDHGESTQRQYALAGEAERLGWPAERVMVIDAAGPQLFEGARQARAATGRGRLGNERAQSPPRVQEPSASSAQNAGSARGSFSISSLVGSIALSLIPISV